jgi:DNA-binding PadR family transcriptional regulator
MERKGLVTSTVDERPGEGPSRRIYMPTPQGLRALVAAHILHGDLPMGAKG